MVPWLQRRFWGRSRGLHSKSQFLDLANRAQRYDVSTAPSQVGTGDRTGQGQSNNCDAKHVIARPIAQRGAVDTYAISNHDRRQNGGETSTDKIKEVGSSWNVFVRYSNAAVGQNLQGHVAYAREIIPPKTHVAVIQATLRNSLFQET